MLHVFIFVLLLIKMELVLFGKHYHHYYACYYRLNRCLGCFDRLVGEAAESSQVSIHSIIQKPTKAAIEGKASPFDFVVITNEVVLSKVKALATQVQQSTSIVSAPLYMPML